MCDAALINLNGVPPPWKFIPVAVAVLKTVPHLDVFGLST